MDINLLNNEQLVALRQLIADAEHIVVCCHQNPDGDAIGSSLAWAEYLRRHDKKTLVAVPDMFPDFLKWMPGTEKIVRYDKHPDVVKSALETADLIFCMDFNKPERTASMGELLKAATAKKVLIDHHPEPSVDAVVCASFPDACSTSELVFRIIWQLDDFSFINSKIAACIYCGMMTDTGGFTYNSCSPEIYFIISQLLTTGINKDKIYRNVFHNYSEWRLRLIGYVLYQRLKVFPKQHAAYYSLSRQDLTRFHYIKGDAEGLVNMPLQIKGMQLSISLREDTEKENLVWVSLRSVDNFSCTKMAEKYFNGGGHLNASGGRLECSLEEAEKIAEKAIMDLTTENK